MKFKRFEVRNADIAAEEFEKLFPDLNTPLRDVIEDKVSAILGRLSIDLSKFDDVLHKAHGPYEREQGWSMAELLRKRYGHLECLFIETLL